jgi:hypothetical protein
MFKTVADDLISRKDLWEAVDGLGTTAEYQEKILEAPVEGTRQPDASRLLGQTVGFAIALIRARRVIGGIMEELKKGKRKFTPKTVDELLWCMIQNRTTFQQNMNATVRYRKDGTFEVYVPEEREE